MGTKIEIENYLGGHCSMGDLSRESNGASWPSFFGENNLPNEQVHHGFLPRNVAGSHSWYDKDVLKQTMLEHESIFKNQVYELHRLYRIQREMMDEVRRKEQFERQIAYETSSSSSPVPSQLKPENLQIWKNGSSHPSENSFYGRPIFGLQTFQNCYSPKNSEVSDSRPTKHRKRIFDLQLSADEYLDSDEVEQFGDGKVSDNISWSPEKNKKVTPKNWKHAGKCKGLADLNEPLRVEETVTISSAVFLDRSDSHSDVKYRDIPTNYSSPLKNGISKNCYPENRPSSQGLFGYALESEQQKGILRYNNQGIHLEKKAARFLPVKVLLDQAGQPPRFLKGGQFSGDSWKVKSPVNIEKSDKSYSVSHYNVTEQMMASHLPSQPSFFIPPDLGRSSDQCSSPWGKLSHNVSQKSMLAQTVPFLAPVNLSKSPQTYSAQSNGFFNLNCSPGANGTFNGEPYIKNGKRLKDMNLNVALPNDKLLDQDLQDPLAALPWLRDKSSCKHKSETSNGPQVLDCSSHIKTPKRETSGPIFPSTSGRKLVFDMNLPCELSDSELDEKEEAGIVEKKMKDESAILRNHFDLNLCITEEEIPCVSITPLSDKGIDLDAPIVLEDEEAILPIEEEAGFARSAAEAIIAISSLANIVQPEICVREEADMEDHHHPLHWLADIACDGLPKELDEFESMTLRLKECTFEEYFPKPSIPQFPNIEEGNNNHNLLTSRITRKGPGRKGRQKRDFQKDILPSLTSLLRHEVSEDMQTFGGLMRANGYSSWQCAPNRKKGGRRGRPRAVVDAPMHTGTEPIVIKQENSSDRSLTDWGKTTRRPRRQRLPPSLPLS